MTRIWGLEEMSRRHILEGHVRGFEHTLLSESIAGSVDVTSRPLALTSEQLVSTILDHIG